MADRPTTNTEVRTVVSVTPEQRQQALFTGQLNPIVQGQYSIALYDSTLNSVVADSSLDPASRTGFAEYFFRVPPQSHEFTEPFSTTIVPTQNGGKFIESHGSIIKMLHIQGTTGLRPNPLKRTIANIPLIGSAADSLTSNFEVLAGQGFIQGDRTVPLSEATGFDDIIFLRNIFRLYSDIKERGSNSRKIVMLWRNAKDADYWVVEPVDFKLTQSSNSPLLYKYDIQFKTLARFNTQINFPEDPLKNILNTRRLFSRVQEYNTALKRTFLVVATQINRLEGAGVFVQTSVLSPLINTIQGLNLVKSTSNNFGVRLAYNAKLLFDNLDSAIDVLENNDSFDRQDSLVREFRRARSMAARVLAEPAVRETLRTVASARRDRLLQAYTSGGDIFNRTRVAPNSGGFTSYIGSDPSNNAGTVAQAIVHVGDDIRSLAGRLLGDRNRWKSLVILNDLKPPYITASGQLGTLKPGDPILYASDSTNSASASLLGVNSPDASDLEGPLQKVYGRDLRLASSTTTDIDLVDISVSQTGDFATLAGINNVDQALRIKFSTEQGELPVHPKFGAKFPLGKKATPHSFNDFHIQAEATIYSDERVKNINSINFNSIGDTLILRASITLVDASDILSTDIPVRRF